MEKRNGPRPKEKKFWKKQQSIRLRMEGTVQEALIISIADPEIKDASRKRYLISARSPENKASMTPAEAIILEE